MEDGARAAVEEEDVAGGRRSLPRRSRRYDRRYGQGNGTVKKTRGVYPISSRKELYLDEVTICKCSEV